MFWWGGVTNPETRFLPGLVSPVESPDIVLCFALSEESSEAGGGRSSPRAKSAFRTESRSTLCTTWCAKGAEWDRILGFSDCAGRARGTGDGSTE